MVTKKILLIPIVLMSCLAAGCEYETYVVPLRDWLDLNGYVSDIPRFKVYNPDEEKTGGFSDYEDYVRTAIRSRTVTAEEVSKNIPKSIVTDSYVEYKISCSIRQMEYCQIRVFENGYVATYAYKYKDIIGSFLGSPKDQKVTYKIDEDKAKEIIELAANRYLEIKEEQKATEAELKEETKIENVLSTFEQSENIPNIRVNYNIPDGAYPSYFPDTNHDLLGELKEIEYEDATDEFIYEKVRLNDLIYRIDDTLVVTLYNHISNEQETNYDLLSVRVINNGKFPADKYFYRYYKIDPQKGLGLVQKAKQLYVNSDQK